MYFFTLDSNSEHLGLDLFMTFNQAKRKNEHWFEFICSISTADNGVFLILEKLCYKIDRSIRLFSTARIPQELSFT